MSKEMSNNPHNMETGPQPGPERKAEDYSFTKLWKEARGELDPAIRAPMIIEIKKRVSYADTKGLIDLPLIADRITETSRNSTFREGVENNFYRKMHDLATNLEKDSQDYIVGREEYNTPEYKGMITEIVEDAKDALSAANLPKIKGVGGKNERDWGPAEWEAIGQKIAPNKVWSSVDEIKEEYNKRKTSLEDDFRSILNLDIDRLSQLIEGPTEEEERMSEANRRLQESRPEYSQTSSVPPGVEMVIRGTIAENMAKQTGAPKGHILEVVDFVKQTDRGVVLNKEDIKEWMTRNFHAFLTRGVEPEKTWKGHMKFWIDNDLMSALRLQKIAMMYDKNGNELQGEDLINANRQYARLHEEVTELKKEMEKKMMVYASVAAQKASGGSFNTYGAFLLGADNRGEVDLAALDSSEAPDLLENNPGIYDDVFKEDSAFGRMVRSNYVDLNKAMGLGKKANMTDIVITNGKVKQISLIHKVDLDAFQDEDTGMFQYMGEGKNGFEDWINARLDVEDAENEAAYQRTGVRPPLARREERWLAAKTAVDLFMVDGKYTKWKAWLDNNIKPDAKGDVKVSGLPVYKMNPFKAWQGDPLGSLHYAPVLPETIKKTFQTAKGQQMMKDVALGFRPSDIIKEESLIPVSSVGGMGFKGLARYNMAVGKYFKNSRGGGVSDWGREGMEGVREMVELIDTYWVGKTFKLKGSNREIGIKQLEGLMTMRLLKVKAEAKIGESREPTWGERFIRPLSADIEDPRTRPNTEGLQTLLGQDMTGRSGYIAELMGDRMGVEFRGEARRLLRETISMLDSNDQSDFWRSLSELLSYVGLSIGITSILTEYALQVSGVGVDIAPKKQRK